MHEDSLGDPGVRGPIDGGLKQVAVFCTQGGSGAEKVLKGMAELCGRKPGASLALNDGEIKRRDHVEKLERFLDGLALPNAA